MGDPVDEARTASSPSCHSPAVDFCARSALPIGAGLGSSASYSTCVAAGFLRLHNVISMSPDASASLDSAEAEVVNQWAFLAEKINHGNPSGIDNAVAVQGGAIAFARAIGGKQGGLKQLKGCVAAAAIGPKSY